MPAAKKLEDDEMLRLAMLEFWRGGWSGTSIRDLERALGLAAPTIYRRFGSKEGLFVAAVGYYIEHIVEARIEKYLTAPSADPLGGLWGFCGSALQAGKATRYRGCLLTLSANEAPELPAAARRSVMDGIERIRAAIGEAVERAVAAGQLDADDPEALGDQVAIAMQGLLVLSRGGMSRVEVARQATHALASIDLPAGVVAR